MTLAHPILLQRQGPILLCDYHGCILAYKEITMFVVAFQFPVRFHSMFAGSMKE